MSVISSLLRFVRPVLIWKNGALMACGASTLYVAESTREQMPTIEVYIRSTEQREAKAVFTHVLSIIEVDLNKWVGITTKPYVLLNEYVSVLRLFKIIL